MKCKHCGQEIEEGSLHCKYCGKQQSEVRYCRKCGHEMGLDDAYCRFCGSAQNVDGATFKISNKMKYGILAVMLILICAGIVLYFFSVKHSNADSAITEEKGLNADSNKSPQNETTLTKVVGNKVFTLFYATSYDGFVNIRERPSSRARILGEITNISSELGDGVLRWETAKHGEWTKVSGTLDSRNVTGWAYTIYLGKISWYSRHGEKVLIAASDNTPIFVENPGRAKE